MHVAYSGRYCARCTYPMRVHQHAHNLYVDHCARCGGSFIDFGKADAVIGEQASPQNWKPEAFAQPPYASPLGCPSGHGRMWANLLAFEKRQVEVDVCPVCYGLWLDANEAPVLDDLTKAAHADKARPGASKGTVGMVAMYLVQLATTIPIEVYHPLKRRPILIYSLVALLIALFIFEIAAIVAFGDSVLGWIALIPANAERGAVHTLVTHAFFHGGIAHLLGNLYFLWIFGDNVEDRLGRAKFTVVYLAAAVAGGAAYWAGNIGSEGAMVGASGAIAGLMGAYFVLFPKVKLWVVLIVIPLKVRATWYLLVWVGMQFLIMLDPKSHVAWLAHVGGFVAGAVLAYLLKPNDIIALGEPSLRPGQLQRR
jgi:membrane associated rhomboid family serine protease/Zn-finger nucleic acid-binding protein